MLNSRSYGKGREEEGRGRRRVYLKRVEKGRREEKTKKKEK